MDEFNPLELIAAHFNTLELKAMDEMQGGASFAEVQVGEGTARIREYSKLGEMIDDPQVQDVFRKAFEVVENTPPDQKQTLEFLSRAVPPPRFDDGGANENPEVKQLADDGKPGDTQIALVPLKFVKFLDTIHEPKINEKDGLREYFGWSEGLAVASLGMQALGLFMQNDEEEELYERRMAAEERNRQRKEEHYKEVLGSLKHLHTPSPALMRIASLAGNNKLNVGNYSKGGIVYKKKFGTAIRGPGKGQDDVIYGPCQAGDHIVDASTVSDLGDGCTEAGYKEVDDFIEKIEEKHDLDKYKGHEPKGKVDVALSAGESRIPVLHVMALGKGDHVKGSQKIERAIAHIRKEKRGGDLDLPPKAKPFSSYFGM